MRLLSEGVPDGDCAATSISLSCERDGHEAFAVEPEATAVTSPEAEIRYLKLRLADCEARLTRLENCFNFIVTLLRQGKVDAMPGLLDAMLGEEAPRKH